MTGYDAPTLYSAAIPYDGVVDRTPSQNLRVEVAFATKPDDANPAWVDLSSRLHLPSGVTVRRGRGSEYDTVQTGTLSCALENLDGALTPDNTASPYYPNVLPQKRIRLSYRDPATLGMGNLMAAEDASFEGGTTGSWLNSYFGSPAAVNLANSTTHPSVGSKGLCITWPTAAAGAGAAIYTPPLVIGRTYTFRCVVWNSAGVPNVVFGDIFGVMGTATSSTTGGFQTLTFTWTATQTQPIMGVRSTGATTAGQQTWIDAVMVDEGTTLGTFTTTAPAINYRFDGHVEEWPIEWPSGSDQYARSNITASDMLARIGGRQELRSVVAETMLPDGPTAYYPLGEPADSLAVYDVSTGSGTHPLTIRQFGVGGTITFAQSTGVPTDGASAPYFDTASPLDGLVLTGRTDWLNNTGSGDSTLTAAVNTSDVNAQVIAAASDDWGGMLALEFDGSGHLIARLWIGFGYGSVAAATSSGTFNDGETHHVAAVASRSGATTTIRLVVDGVTLATDTTSWGIPLLCNVTIGGSPLGEALYTGTVSHVAVFPAALTDTQLLEHRLAQSTGFAGERSDQRIARIAKWAGIPTSRQVLDVGMTTSVDHVDCTGMSPLEYMRKIEKTEGGLLFADMQGRLTFQARSRSYARTAPALSVPVHMVDPRARMVSNLQFVRNEVTGSRPKGATVRMVNQPSIDTYGPLAESLELVTTSDAEVADAVAWRLNLSANPMTRLDDVGLDGYTDPTYSPQVLSAIMLGAHIQITGLPSQAPSSTLDQLVQGYTESIRDDGWDIAVNASPYLTLVAFVLDDATYGLLDSTNRLVY
jgi:hypothetical protein